MKRLLTSSITLVAAFAIATPAFAYVLSNPDVSYQGSPHFGAAYKPVDRDFHRRTGLRQAINRPTLDHQVLTHYDDSDTVTAPVYRSTFIPRETAGVHERVRKMSAANLARTNLMRGTRSQLLVRRINRSVNCTPFRNASGQYRCFDFDSASLPGTLVQTGHGRDGADRNSKREVRELLHWGLINDRDRNLLWEIETMSDRF